MVTLIVLLAVAAFILVVVARTIRIVPQARAGVIERFGLRPPSISSRRLVARDGHRTRARPTVIQITGW